MDIRNGEERTVTCDVCGRTFSSHDEHDMHHRTAHGAITDDERGMPEEGNSDNDDMRKPLM